MSAYEKLGLFYLGRTVNAEGAAEGDYLYDAKDLTTHAVIVGMTGSGKTGLGVALIEEAAIDGLPVIAIDPKGDIGNLLLTFPEFRAEDFRPWVEPAAAAAAGKSPEEYAAAEAARWKDGLAEWGQPVERVAKFAGSVERTVYTPGSAAGVPLTMLKSFAAPPAAVTADAEAFRDRISAAASGLLSLAGVESDPLTGREHVLVATILDGAWRAGTNLELGDVVRLVQAPPFAKVGAFDLESFYPAKERTGLAMRLNALLASPGFAGWLEGEPLDVGRLLYTSAGRPRLSVLSISHLAEAERMFFVTLLLGEVVAWMRSQPGTSTLRAILYMDEIAGYFPPVGEPPSKRPMLTLLKQARAYGVGVVLATQNPVDLDYKGLSNAGTWFLGRLQTERDKARVLEGLEGASATAGSAFDRQKTEARLAGLAPRTFYVNNVHEDAPCVIKTRWTLSYLRGPLTREQIATLMAGRKAPAPALPPAAVAPAAVAPLAPVVASTGVPLALPPGVEEFVLPAPADAALGKALVYRPGVLGRAKPHYVKAGAAGVDVWTECAFLLSVSDGELSVWDDAEAVAPNLPRLLVERPADGTFAELPAAMLNAKSYAAWTKGLKDYVYRTQALSLWRCAALKSSSKPGETEGEYRVRLDGAAREARDAAVEKLRKKYASKLAALEKRTRAAEQRIEREQGQATRAGYETVLSVGSSIFGAVFGRKLASATNVGRAATAARSVGRASEQRGDVKRATDSLDELKAEAARLKEDLDAEAERVAAEFDPRALEVEEVRISPRKSDTQIAPAAVVWCPWAVEAGGFAEPAWKRG